MTLFEAQARLRHSFYGQHDAASAPATSDVTLSAVVKDHASQLSPPALLRPKRIARSTGATRMATIAGSIATETIWHRKSSGLITVAPVDGRKPDNVRLRLADHRGDGHLARDAVRAL